MREALKEIGIDMALAITGFLGSMAMLATRIIKRRKVDWLFALASIFVGILTASYVTPIVLIFTRIEGSAQYGVAYICGYAGHRAIDAIWERYERTINVDKNEDE